MRPTPSPASSELAFLRERQILARIPVSRATWWRWIKAGRAPKPVRLGPGIVAWRVSDIDALAASFVTETESNVTPSRGTVTGEPARSPRNAEDIARAIKVRETVLDLDAVLEAQRTLTGMGEVGHGRT